MNLSKVLVVVFGTLAFVISCVLALAKIQSFVQTFLAIVGLFGAPLGAVFILGVFTKRANWLGVLTGMIAGFVAVFPIFVMSNLIPKGNRIVFADEYFGIISFFTTLIVGYSSSFLFATVFKVKNKSLTNITAFTQTKEFKLLLKKDKELAKTQKLYAQKRISEIQKNAVMEEFLALEKTVDAQI